MSILLNITNAIHDVFEVMYRKLSFDQGNTFHKVSRKILNIISLGAII
jgi:hypothetical protein